MPKSTATSRPSIVHEQIARMHVGVEEAVADGVAQERLDHGAPERRPVEARRLDGRHVVQADAVDPRDGQHVAGGQLPFGLRHAEIGIVPVFSASSETAAASRRRSISTETERASASTISTGLRRRASGTMRSNRRAAARMAWRSRAKPLAHAGPHHLDGDRQVALGRADPGLVHLRDRGGGDRLAEFDEELVDGTAERDLHHARPPRRGGKGGIRSCSRSRSRAAASADDVGAGGEELAELHVRRPEPGQRRRAGAPRRRRRCAARSMRASRRPEPRGGGKALGSIERERALAGQDEAGMRQLRSEMDEAADHASDLPAGMDVRRCRRSAARWVTRLKPASSIIRAKAAGGGKRRIDSTRYW